MRGFAGAALEPLALERGPAIRDMYALSPYVWSEGGGYSMMLRIVPDEPDPADKIARIHYGRSEDGLRFVIDDDPVIAPGPDPDDLHGCEDPTVVSCPDGYHVFYTGWNEDRKEGKLMHAFGPNVWRLEKRGAVLELREGRNPKEATVIQARAGDWRMFFEFAAEGTSRIGVARSDLLDGPWEAPEPLCAGRSHFWDNWHTSTGPVWQPEDGPPIMFYNGADRSAHWRIGWLVLDEDCMRAIHLSDHPLIAPPVPTGDATDIAFAASCIEEDGVIRLYYSIADKDMVRATLRPV